jgi:hypothetical protein
MGKRYVCDTRNATETPCVTWIIEYRHHWRDTQAWRCRVQGLGEADSPSMPLKSLW